MPGPLDELKLTAEQQKAVESESRNLVVVANAGAGKTETVARRVMRILDSVNAPTKILALSYTNRAAAHLRNRLIERAGSRAEAVTTDTIHGFAHSLLRQHGTRIGLPIEPEVLTRDADRVELLNTWRDSEGLPPIGKPSEYFARVDLLRATLQDDVDVEEWRAALASLPALDYQGILDSAANLLELRSVQRQLARTYSHVIVDEAQNLTPSQYRVLEMVIGDSETGPSAMLVGDDKQSIVSFAGADPRLIWKFVDDRHADVLRLDQNFRSAEVLSRLGDALTARLGNRVPEQSAHAARGRIEAESLSDEAHEGKYVARWVRELLVRGLPKDALAEGESTSVRPEEIAVLGRSAAALRHTAEYLDAQGIEYTLSSRGADWLSSVAGELVLEIIAKNAAPSHASTNWRLRRILGSESVNLDTLSDLQSALRTHTDPLLSSMAGLASAGSVAELLDGLEGVQEIDAEEVNEQANLMADLEELKKAWNEFRIANDSSSHSWANFRMFCLRRQRGSAAQGVQLLTVHKAQGMEFKAVAIVGMNDGQIPDFRASTEAEKLSELRTFYVAVTRARRVLLLSRARSRNTRYRIMSTRPSPYLSYLPK